MAEKMFLSLMVCIIGFSAGKAQYLSPLFYPLFEGQVFYNPAYFKPYTQWQMVQNTDMYLLNNGTYFRHLLSTADIALDSSTTRLGITHSYYGNSMFNTHTASIHGSYAVRFGAAWHLSFGGRLSAVINEYDLRDAGLDPNDPLAIRRLRSYLDADVGVWLTDGKSSAGLSLKSLRRPYHRFFNQDEDAFKPELYALLGHKFQKRSWTLEGIARYQNVLSTSYRLDGSFVSLNFELGYRNRYFLGAFRRVRPYSSEGTMRYLAKVRIKRRINVFSSFQMSGSIRQIRWLQFGMSYTVPTS